MTHQYVSEIILPSRTSHLQEAVDYINIWSQENRLELNPSKCKEILTCFKRIPTPYAQLNVNALSFERTPSARILGMTLRNDFKWNDHVEVITTKTSKRLYLLKQLKGAGINHEDLVLFYCNVIKSTLEYSCQLFHQSLPNYLSDEIERIQRRALRIIYPSLKYRDALAKANITTLLFRRELLSRRLFSDIANNKDHKLAELLPPKSNHNKS